MIAEAVAVCSELTIMVEVHASLKEAGPHVRAEEQHGRVEGGDVHWEQGN